MTLATPSLSSLVEEAASAVQVVARVARGRIRVTDHRGNTLCEFGEGPTEVLATLTRDYRLEAEPVGTIEARAEQADEAIALVKELFDSVYRRRLVAAIYTSTLSDSYEELLAKNQHLERLADSLERQVEERTRELDQAHAHLAREARVVAISKLAAGMAHELNTPLACVRSNLLALGNYRSPVDDPEFDDVVGESVEMIDRAAAIVGDLLGLAHARDQGWTRIDLVEELKRSIRCLHLPDVIRLEQCLEPVPPIRVDGKRLVVALLHLLENARDALVGGGTLRVATHQLDDTVVLLIEDDGVGMLPEVRERAFDPFFTTKEVGEGVGLGLTVARDVIQAHGGTLELSSRTGGGTTTRTILPIGSVAHEKENRQ